MKFLTKPVVYSLYGISVAFIVIGLIVLSKSPEIATTFTNHAYDILNMIELPV